MTTVANNDRHRSQFRRVDIAAFPRFYGKGFPRAFRAVCGRVFQAFPPCFGETLFGESVTSDCTIAVMRRAAVPTAAHGAAALADVDAVGYQAAAPGAACSVASEFSPSIRPPLDAEACEALIVAHATDEVYRTPRLSP